MNSCFRVVEPTAEQVESFHRDGFIALKDIMTDEARQGLIDELVRDEGVRQFLNRSDEERPLVHFVRPWNDRGPWSDRLIDDPLVTALLRATIGPDYHFCHSAFNVSVRGAGPGQLHQDHHHWRHEYPVNLAERDKYYIQILYYPNGFGRKDRGLQVLPGSHRVAPSADVTAEGLLRGDFDAEAGRKLVLEHLELPPGSAIYLNARMFHGVDPKPLDSPQPYRLFAIDIFKEAGPPHRYTQEIPPAWIERASPERKKLFMRPAYTEESWARSDF